MFQHIYNSSILAISEHFTASGFSVGRCNMSLYTYKIAPRRVYVMHILVAHQDQSGVPSGKATGATQCPKAHWQLAAEKAAAHSFRVDVICCRIWSQNIRTHSRCIQLHLHGIITFAKRKRT